MLVFSMRLIKAASVCKISSLGFCRPPVSVGDIIHFSTCPPVSHELQSCHAALCQVMHVSSTAEASDEHFTDLEDTEDRSNVHSLSIYAILIYKMLTHPNPSVPKNSKSSSKLFSDIDTYHKTFPHLIDVLPNFHEILTSAPNSPVQSKISWSSPLSL
jgi:hypothetical protein